MSAVLLNAPAVEPATTQATYPIIWLTDFVCHADPNGVTTIAATLDAACQNGDGSYTLYPPARQQIFIPDLWGTATLSEVELMTDLVTAIKLRAGI